MLRNKSFAVLSSLLIAVFALSGCSSSGLEAKVPSVVEQTPDESKTIFDEGCDKFRNGELTHSHLDIYEPLLQDICQDFQMDYELVSVQTSPGADKESVDLYVNNYVFGLSYWDRYVPGGLKPLAMYILMEDEKEWWMTALTDVLKIEPEWFGPTDGGGHCYAAEAEAFCPKAYYALDGETKGDQNVLATMLGSKLEWTTFRKVTPIHEATHQFHSTTGLGNWRYWYVEGQATYFELASSVLVSDLGATNWREELASQTMNQDEKKFNAKTPAETFKYMKMCENGGNCNGFSYFGGSLAHELLVTSFGIDKYMDFNLAIANRLPDYFWRGMNDADRKTGIKGFEKTFQEFFGTEIEDWERNSLAPFVLDVYQCEVLRQKCS